MGTAAYAATSFNGGELSPRLAARIDFQKWPTGCQLLRNYIPTVQGPAQQRPGSRFVAEVKDSTKRTWLGKFEFNTDNAYTLEFGDAYIRFFTRRAQLVSGPTPVEVVTPWVQSSLFNADNTSRLRMAQSGDFLYVTHGDYQQQILQRMTATSFALTAFEAIGGPFKDLNDTTTTVYASAATGTGITLTASTAIFLAGHVGSLFLLEAKSLNDVAAWEPAKAITAGMLRRVGSRVYLALTSATTGSSQPVHTEGALIDGDTGVQWQFQDAGFGWVRITAAAGLTATADVLSNIPANAVGSGNATTRWAHGAWSDVEGWPTDVAFFRERLVFMRRQQGWMSVASGFDDFSSRDPSGQVTADMAISFTLSSGQINDVQWLLPDKDLLAGTAAGEFAIGELTNGSAIGPGNIRVQLQSQYGSRAIVPAQAGSTILFVQRAGRKLREISYSFTADGYQSTDRTSLSEHITYGGVIDLDYAQEPDSVVWCTKGDGGLSGFTWNAEHNVWAWHSHTLSGNVESVVCVPSPDQSVNDVWLIVNRTINGVTRRYVEFIEEHWEDGDAQDDAFYVDSGLTLDNGQAATLTPGANATVAHAVAVPFIVNAPIFVPGDVNRQIHYRYATVDENGIATYRTAKATITEVISSISVNATINVPFPSTALVPALEWRLTVMTITGLNHLEGQTVAVLANGAPHPQRVVTGGSITLQNKASIAQVGLPMVARLQTMRIEAGAQNGTAQGKTKRISKVTYRLKNTSSGRFGPNFDEMDEFDFRVPDNPMDEPVPPFTGDKLASFPVGYGTDGFICYENSKPLPSTVVGLFPIVATQDAR